MIKFTAKNISNAKHLTEKDKKEQLKWFKHFVEICKKHNIWYSVVFGTALGAIRHKGPIPWDDDYDVVMTYESYEKLKKLFL